MRNAAGMVGTSPTPPDFLQKKRKDEHIYFFYILYINAYNYIIIERFLFPAPPEQRMKRSVIAFAGKSLIISLPKAWTIAQHIKKGQELDVTPAGDKLIITSAPHRAHQRLSLSEKDAPWFTADILNMLYQRGIDEITITYDTDAIAGQVRERAASLLGFEVVAQMRKSITVKNVAAPLEEEYATLQRRAFYVLQEMGEALLQQATHPSRQLQDELRTLDIMVNKLTDFCKRTLNKHEAHTALSTSAQYSIVRDLEKIGDEYKKCGRHITRALPTFVRQSIKDINVFFALLHDLMYGFSPELAGKFHQQKATLERQQHKLFMAMRTRLEVMHLISIITLVKDLFGPVLMLHLHDAMQDARDQ